MSALTQSGRGAASPRPMNVEQIVREAQNFDYNPHVPLKYWFRSASTLLKEAEIYEHEGNEQQTYLLLFRHAELVLKSLAEHPDAHQAMHRASLAHAEREVVRSLAKMEMLKPRINRTFERFQKQAAERKSILGLRSRRPDSTDTSGDGLMSPKKLKRQSPIELPAAELAAGENKDFAVRLAHTEIKRRALARKATRQAGIPEEVEHQRRTAGVWGNWEEALSNDPEVDRDSLSREIQSVRSQVDGRQEPLTSPTAQNGASRSSSITSLRPTSNYRYPSIRSPSVPENGSQPSSPVRTEPPARGLVSLLNAPSAPLVPPKEDIAPKLPPPRPAKQPPAELESPASPPLTATTTTTAPSSASSLHPSSSAPDAANPGAFTFSPSAHLESGAPLRTIFLPPDLRHRFQELAATNTRRNLETCGILCGTLIANALFVSRLVMPEQMSTSDTCETVNENRLFDYVDGEDLLMLGWIHTHPTQTCFMSSRDLHTHCGYQVMLPESIAIVLAPSRNDWGVFRLTDPPGMKSVLNCKQTGLFHPHAEQNIYTDALRPGHVFEANGLEFDIHDMRNG